MAARLNGMQFLADTLKGAIRNIEEIAAAEQSGEIAGKHFLCISLNLPVFVQFMSNADRLLGDIGADDAQIVHDQTTEFEPAFRWAFSTFIAAKSEASIKLQNGTVVYFGLDRLKHFRTGDSVAEPEIQGADLLAAALRTIFVSLVTGRPLATEVSDIARLILGQRPQSQEGNFWIMGSEKLWRSFARLYNPPQIVTGAA